MRLVLLLPRRQLRVRWGLAVGVVGAVRVAVPARVDVLGRTTRAWAHPLPPCPMQPLSFRQRAAEGFVVVVEAEGP